MPLTILTQVHPLYEIVCTTTTIPTIYNPGQEF